MHSSRQIAPKSHRIFAISTSFHDDDDDRQEAASYSDMREACVNIPETELR